MPFPTRRRTASPPRWAVLGLSVLFLTLALSGCLSADGGATTVDPDGQDGNDTNNTTTPSPTPTPTPSPDPTGDGNTTDGNQTGGNTTGNQTTGNSTLNSTIDWGDPAAAKVRPGVQTVFNDAQCTANFVYHSPDRDAYYLGSAAHCMDGGSYGDGVQVRDRNGATAFTGSFVYSSWIEAGHVAEGEELDENAATPIHDFALIEIPSEEIGNVHPATLFWGGPTKLGDTSTLNLGDPLLAYGNTGLRGFLPESTNHQEGYFREMAQRSSGPAIVANLVTPTIPGDSGSGLMTADGAAIGVASYILLYMTTVPPAAAQWEYASIPYALDYANSARGWDLELVTWDLL